MSNQTNPEDFSKDWRQRVNELESIPGEPSPDSNKIWAKLEASLHENPPKKKRALPWYWVAAAACLLIALLIFVSKEQAGIDKSNMVQQVKPQKKKANNIIEVANSTNNRNAKAPVKKTVTTISNKVGNELANKRKPIEIPKEILSVIDTTANIFVNNDIPVNVPVAIQVPKKSARVIHINELTVPQVITTPVVRNNFRHSSKNELSDQDTWQQEPTSPLIKINLSPQN